MTKKQKEEFALWKAMLKDSLIDYNLRRTREENQKKQILQVMPLWELKPKPKKK